jgi:hypothetical protein
MTDELERLLKEAVMAQLKYYPGICEEGLRRNMKIPSQVKQCHKSDSD